MAIDVMYPLGSGSKWNNGELRYSLRALEKNFLDLGRVFICTTSLPPWLTGVVHIPVPDTHRRNKDANLIDKVLAACNAGITDFFVRSSDDQMLLMPMHTSDFKKYHAGQLSTKSAAFWKGAWKKRMRHTYKVLTRNQMPSLHFDTHIPTLYDRDLFRDVMGRYRYARGIGYCINTLYVNHEALHNPPPLGKRKLTLEKPVNDPAILRSAISGRQFLGYNDKGLTPAIKQVLQELFPTPSRFETDGEQNNTRIEYTVTTTSKAK